VFVVIVAQLVTQSPYPGSCASPLLAAQFDPVDLVFLNCGIIPPVLNAVLSLAERLYELALHRHPFWVKIDERQKRVVSRKEAGWGDLGEMFPIRRPPGRDPLLLPPRPQITPSARILQLAAEQDIEPEAAG
jgi:hypothetical protein